MALEDIRKLTEETGIEPKAMEPDRLAHLCWLTQHGLGGQAVRELLQHILHLQVVMEVVAELNRPPEEADRIWADLEEEVE